MSVVVVVTALPLPEHRDTVIAAFEKAIEGACPKIVVRAPGEVLTAGGS